MGYNFMWKIANGNSYMVQVIRRSITMYACKSNFCAVIASNYMIVSNNCIDIITIWKVLPHEESSAVGN